MKKEQWEKIKQFPQYWISNLGRIYSTNSKRILKIKYINGYSSGIVYLTNANKNIYKQIVRVDKLVAQAFIKDFDITDEIQHKDHNIRNNELSNLKNIPISFKNKTDRCYVLINEISLNSIKYHTLKEIHDFFHLSPKTVSAFKQLQNVAKNRGYKLKKIENIAKVKKKDEIKRHIYRNKVQEFTEYVEKTYPDGTEIDMHDPIVTEHYKFMKEWNQ